MWCHLKNATIFASHRAISFFLPQTTNEQSPQRSERILLVQFIATENTRKNRGVLYNTGKNSKSVEQKWLSITHWQSWLLQSIRALWPGFTKHICHYSNMTRNRKLLSVICCSSPISSTPCFTAPGWSVFYDSRTMHRHLQIIFYFACSWSRGNTAALTAAKTWHSVPFLL